jgi:coenzyme F420-reducing hydrogenase delta subunit
METIPQNSVVTVFVCANCARPGQAPTSSGRSRPSVPDFQWPETVEQIVIPCTGRLQPENVLKVFEAGSSVVSIIACQDDNCHHVEGSKRCSHRVDFIRSILDEIGLGGERLLLSYLPGSATQDLALAARKPVAVTDSDLLEKQISSIRNEIAEALRTCPPNPLLALESDSDCSADASVAGGRNAHE